MELAYQTFFGCAGVDSGESSLHFFIQSMHVSAKHFICVLLHLEQMVQTARPL